MTRPQRLAARHALALLCLLAGVASADAGNQLTIRVTHGPYAGSYQAGSTEILCFKVAAQDVFSAAWIHPDKTGRGLADAGVEVSHPDAPGPRRGYVSVRFGTDGKLANYQLSNQALSFSLTAQGARISVDGQTKDGIGIHLEAVCTEVERH